MPKILTEIMMGSRVGPEEIKICVTCGQPIGDGKECSWPYQIFVKRPEVLCLSCYEKRMEQVREQMKGSENGNED